MTCSLPCHLASPTGRRGDLVDTESTERASAISLETGGDTA